MQDLYAVRLLIFFISKSEGINARTIKTGLSSPLVIISSFIININIIIIISCILGYTIDIIIRS